MVSALVARQSGAYHLKTNAHAKLVPIMIDIERVFDDTAERPLVECFEAFETGFADLSRLFEGQGSLTLTYEDDIERDPVVAYRRVCEYLGVETPSVPVRLARTNPFPLSDVIVNFAEVDRALAGTRFAWMTRE